MIALRPGLYCTVNRYGDSASCQLLIRVLLILLFANACKRFRAPYAAGISASVAHFYG
jgi:hypothetical protein